MIYGVVPAFEQLELTVIDWAVWAALCTFNQWERVDGKPVRSKPATCFPTIRAIAERAHCSRAEVFRALSHLEALGLIERKAQIGENGERRSNFYTLYAEPKPKA